MIAQGFNWWVVIALVCVLLGQSAVGQSVPDSKEMSGADPDSVILNQATALTEIPEDALRLRLLDIAIEKAELDVSASDFWHRLIPQVQLSASFGVQQLAFIDPATFTPSVLPKDSYRLTLSLSLSDVFSPVQHEQALLTQRQLRVEREMLDLQLKQNHHRRFQEHLMSQQELDMTLKELTLLNELLQYVELLFGQGKTDFATLIRARLQVLNSQKAIIRLRAQVTKGNNHAIP